MYCITLGEGRRVTPRAYLAALKMAMANPDREFKESFRSSWIPATGKEIVAQHWEMIADKYASQLAPVGKGNRAQKRAQGIRDSHAECKWCGQPIATERQQFCCRSCAQAYNGF